LQSIRLYWELGIWIEITTLIIPGLNDSPEMLGDTARFIAAIDTNIPWHVTAYYPTYHLTDRKRTPLASLLLARDIGRQAGLAHVYAGNIPGSGAEDTHCPGCGSLLIERRGYAIAAVNLDRGACASCGLPCSGIFA
jgi:pyruvate formate lyase activating enzyme